MALDVVTLVSDGGVGHGIPSVCGGLGPVYEHDQAAIWRTPVSHGKVFGMDGSKPVRPKGRTGFDLFIQRRRCPFDSGLTEPFGFGEPESRGRRLALNEEAHPSDRQEV